MAKNLTEEKIKYLLFLYDRKTHPLSVTAAAKPAVLPNPRSAGH